MNPPQILERYRRELDQELQEVVKDSPVLFYRMMRYHLGWEDTSGQPSQESAGKRVRPTLCLLACEAVGGDYRRALPAAAAIELIHNFSLIHDDIEDGSSERRHRPTVWSLWGQAQAINVGDGMYTLARCALWRLQEQGIPPQTILRGAAILDEACLGLCEGQFLDLSYEGRLDITTEDYLAMIRGKTASLLGAALEVGALLGSGDALVIQRYRRCGEKLGLAFQIRDDFLGIWGREDLLGKSTAQDILNRKKSFPIVYALETADAAQKAVLVEVYSRKRPRAEDVASVLRILAEVGAQEATQQWARQLLHEALAELEPSSVETSAQQELRLLATFLVERDY